MEFLSSISSPGDLQHQQSINSLISTLMSLDDGEVLPLLKPPRHPGRPRNSVAKEYAKAKVVWVVKRLCETGMDTNEVYKFWIISNLNPPLRVNNSPDATGRPSLWSRLT